MKAIQTIELSDQERIVVQQFLKLIDDISCTVGRVTMHEVFDYFVEEAEINADDTYSIGALHDITKM